MADDAPRDNLRGGAGRDSFVFSASFGNDTLHDFTVGFDSIDLSALGVGTYTTLLANTADVSGDAVITLSGNTITLSNVTKSQLQSGDFIGLTPEATAGNDTMNGTGSADNLDGLGGNEVFYASLLIFFGMVFDMLDGSAARLTNQTSEFGAQLDSLCDAISFGVAPAFKMRR